MSEPDSSAITDKKYQPDLEDPPFALQYDAIREKSPKAGARIVKLGAEMRLGRLLAVGWSICVVINMYFLISNFSLDRLWLAIALVAGIVAASSFRNQIAKLQRESVQDHWLILQCDQWLMSTRSSSATSAGSEREASVRSE